MVLNRSYFPIQTTSVKRAVGLLCLEIAVGLDSEYQTYDWEDLLEGDLEIFDREEFHLVRAVEREIPVPKVLLLREYDRRPPQNVRFSRQHIFIRDRNMCQYCARVLPKQKLNLDHVVPRVQGGRTTWDNVVTSCHPCNRKKGGRTPAQAGMQLLSVPAKPRISPTMTYYSQENRGWSTFLFQDTN